MAEPENESLAERLDKAYCRGWDDAEKAIRDSTADLLERSGKERAELETRIEELEKEQAGIKGLPIRSYQLLDHASIEWRGETGWAITDGFGFVLGHSGKWEWEPNPSRRDNPFVSRTRYPTPEVALEHWKACGEHVKEED